MYEWAPFQLNSIMTLTCVLEFTAAMQFTIWQAPMLDYDGFVDRFNKVRKMIDAFNQLYAEKYHPWWLNCLVAVGTKKLKEGLGMLR